MIKITNKRIVIRYCIALFVVILAFLNVNGQEYEDIISPSPTAAALGEYGNITDVSSTGAHEINIPLWEVKGRQLKVPISISYRTSGIKVEDQGSSIGLGWTLNASGVITRSILGEPDDPVSEKPAGLPWTIDNYQRDVLWGLLDKFAIGFDHQPDKNYYNFPGYSGRFVYDHDYKPMIYPNRELNITNNVIDHVPGKTVVDGNGVIHYFNEQESSQQGATAWWLTRMESADGSEWIEFKYAYENIAYFAPEREVLFIDAMSQFTAWEGGPILKNYGTKRLTEINTSFGTKVKFVEGEERQDYIDYSSNNNPRVLDYIEILHNDQCIRKIDFELELVQTNWKFSESDYSSGVFMGYDMDWANKRYYLKSVTEESCNSNVEKKHEFEYYGRYSWGKDELPNKMSMAQDHWGYYNGKRSNKTLRPTYTGKIPYEERGEDADRTVLGGDRSSSFPEMRCGTLKSISYPTNGKTEYVYSAHIAKTPEYMGSESIIAGGLCVSTLNNYNGQNIVKSINYQYDKGYLVDFPTYTSDLIYVQESGLSGDETLHHYIHPQCQWGSTIPNGEERTGDCRQYVRVCAGNPVSLGVVNGYHLNYENITTYETNNGRVVKSYTTAHDFPDVAFNDDPYYYYDEHQYFYLGYVPYEWRKGTWVSQKGWPYGLKTDYSWKRGKLSSESVYIGEETDPVKQVNYQYNYQNIYGTVTKAQLNSDGSQCTRYYKDTENPSPLYGLTVNRTVFLSHFIQSGNFGFVPIEETMYYWGCNLIQPGIAQLGNKIVMEDGITTTIDYEYNELNQVSKETTTKSDGTEFVTRYKYPKEYDFETFTIGSDDSADDQCQAIEEMLECNMVNFPIEIFTTNKEDGIEYVVNGKINGFDHRSGIGGGEIVVPHNKFQLEVSDPIIYSENFGSYIKKSSNGNNDSYSFIKNNDYIEKVRYDEHDNHSNLLQYHKINDVDICFLLGL